MKKSHLYEIFVIVLMIMLAFYMPREAAAEFTPSNGQAAALVLGQWDFDSNAGNKYAYGMRAPAGMAVDPTTGKVFVADNGNSRVLRFPSATALTNGAEAEAVLGQEDFFYNFPNRGGTVDDNTMQYPLAVSVDAEGRLWVADTENNRVLRFDNAANKANGADADGVLGQADFVHGDPNRGDAVGAYTLNIPYGITSDSSGGLWVADTVNNRVLRFDNAASKPNGANADGVLGQPGFNSNTVATTQNGMDGPTGMFADSSGRLWVADQWNHRILWFNNAAGLSDGTNADGVLGQPTFTSSGTACTQSGMFQPHDVSSDPAGRLYVSDRSNNRVLIFENASGLADGANASSVLGQTDFTTCTSGISDRMLYHPGGISYDPAAKVLWIADVMNHRVLMYGNTGPLANLVLGQPDFTHNTSATSPNGMNYPYSIAIDPVSGKTFLADYGNNRVLRFASATALANGAAAEAVLGQENFTSGSANRGGSVDANTMYLPTSMFVDSGGRLWVADSQNNRILRFDSAATKVNGAGADGVLGQNDFSSRLPNRGGSVARNTLYAPAGVFIDSSGRLWATEFGNNRVLRFDNAATKTNGADADGVLGQLDFTHNAPQTSSNGFNSPIGVFASAGGELWVADLDNNRVLRFDNAALRTAGGDADVVLGHRTFVVDDTACTQDGMHAPQGVSGDSYGRLYVTDSNNHRLLVFENAEGLENGSSAYKVIGQPNLNTCNANAGGVSAASLNVPVGVFYDPATRVLWVADWNNHRVLGHESPWLRVFLPVARR